MKMESLIFNFVSATGDKTAIPLYLIEHLTMRIKYEAQPLFETLLNRQIEKIMSDGQKLLSYSEQNPSVRKIIYNKNDDGLLTTEQMKVGDYHKLRTVLTESIIDDIKTGKKRLDCTLEEIYNLVISCIDFRLLSKEDAVIVKAFDNWQYQDAELVEGILQRCLFRFSQPDIVRE